MATCGTVAGHAAHYRHSTEPCDACRAAVAEYRRQWKANNGAAVQAAQRRERLRWRALSELRRRHLIEYDQILADLMNSEQP